MGSSLLLLFKKKKVKDTHFPNVAGYMCQTRKLEGKISLAEYSRPIWICRNTQHCLPASHTLFASTSTKLPSCSSVFPVAPEGIKQWLAAWLPAKIPPLKLQITCHLLDHRHQGWEFWKRIIDVNCSRLHKRKPRPRGVQSHSWAVKMRSGNQVSWLGSGGRETCHHHPPGEWLPQESSLFLLLLPEHLVPLHALQTLCSIPGESGFCVHIPHHLILRGQNHVLPIMLSQYLARPAQSGLSRDCNTHSTKQNTRNSPPSPPLVLSPSGQAASMLSRGAT